jgi:YVTN family beta-propeller protein
LRLLKLKPARWGVATSAVWAIMRSKAIIALGLIGLGLLGGCGESGNTAITTVPTAHLTITLTATTVTAGTPFTFTVKALDAMGAVVVTYSGTVHIATSDTAAKLPADATLAQGVGTFTVTFNSTGNQTITASDTVGDASAGSSPAISVQPVPVPKIASLSPGLTAAGGAGFTLIVYGSNFVLTSVVQWNGSNRSTAFVSSGQLTAQITAADIATAGAATVTVFNPAPGGGRSNSSTFTVTTAEANSPESIAVDPSGKFAYVLNGGGVADGTVSMYTINHITGALVSIGSPVSTNGFGVYAGAIVVDPSGRFVYVTNEGDPWGYEEGANGSVEIYTIGATTGALTNTGTINGNCPGLCDPGPMAVDPSGKFAYVETGGAGGPFSLAMYKIGTMTGALTSIGTIAAGGVPYSVAVDPAGKFVYVATANVTPTSAGSVLMYAINVTTGALASTGSIAAGTNPASLAVAPAGKFAYVTNASSNNVSMYTIDATTGALTSIGTIAAGTQPSSVAVDPASKFAYVTNYGSKEVSMYSINSTTGSLTLIGTIAAELNPSSIAIHPSGKFAYVTNSGSDNVSMYSINSTTGSLTPIGTIGP